uniref:Uncharacterized protein n=1 Tax=Mycobacterium riyadhense TaxID=486698 RepID=A0A653F6D2_9MYCO|nr:hypothetical protein [Mycobacterium riyadhense]VTP04532.1 hypothetical protein BIN_B_05571 [Mycobacterium riyadhense]
MVEHSPFVASWRVGVSVQQFVEVVGVVDLGWAVTVGQATSPAVGDDGAPFAAARHAVVSAAGEEQLVRYLLELLERS